MSDVAIRVEGLGKQYRIGKRVRYESLRDRLAEMGTAPFKWLWRSNSPSEDFAQRPEDEKPSNTFWALKDVNFEVKRGEVLGIIGRNGAGKSTLLKILSRITEPTTGRIEVRGRVGSLLEVGTGFHPELTGRENVYLNGAILGMKRHEIARKFDEIVEFAGVEEFIDTQVKHYSSGMYMRLAFAVAAHLEPEILIVDEVLAVGDVQFQKKCLGKMGKVAKEGRTVLFVSHNTVALESICSIGIELKNGVVNNQGLIQPVLAKYVNSGGTTASYDVSLVDHENRVIRDKPILKWLKIYDSEGELCQQIKVGSAVVFEVGMAWHQPLPNLQLGLHFHNELDQRIMSFHSYYQSRQSITLSRELSLQCHCPEIQLAPGRYNLTIGVTTNGQQVDRIEPTTSIEVVPSDYYQSAREVPAKDGTFWPRAEWKLGNTSRREIVTS